MGSGSNLKKILAVLSLVIVMVVVGVWVGSGRESWSRFVPGSDAGRIYVTDEDERYDVGDINEGLVNDYLNKLGVWEERGARGAINGVNDFITAEYIEILLANTPEGNQFVENGEVVAATDIVSKGDGISIRMYFSESKIGSAEFESAMNIELLKALYLIGSDAHGEGISKFNEDLQGFVKRGEKLVAVEVGG